MIGRVVHTTAQSPSMLIIVRAALASEVTTAWTMVVLRGDTDEPVPGGEVEVLRVSKQLLVGRTRLTADQLAANPRVRMNPP